MKRTAILLAALLVAGSAFAQTPPPGGMGAGMGRGGMAACRDDAQKFCSDKTGPDRRACMDANKDKLSDACKQARADRIKAMGH